MIAALARLQTIGSMMISILDKVTHYCESDVSPDEAAAVETSEEKPAMVIRGYVKPWIGENYGAGRSKYGKLRVLILGESAYEWIENGRIRRASATQIVNWYWKKGSYGKSTFARKLVPAFFGVPVRSPNKSKTYPPLGDFFDSIACTNFVQERVGVGPKARPTPAMCRASVPAFERLLADLKPQCVIITSKLAWNWLKDLGDKRRPLRVDGTDHEVRMFPTTRGRLALGVSTLHPSCRNFRFGEWHGVITRAMTVARSLAS